MISYDRLILGTQNVDYYASFDNEQGRRAAGQLHRREARPDGRRKKGPFNIELFAGSNDDNNTKYFFNGAMSVLQPYIDKKQLVVQSGQTELNQVTTLRWDGGTAQSRMDDLLTKSYKSEQVDAVLSPYDGISIGILSALKSDGYGSKSKPLPVVTGQDAELASVKSIIAGEQTQTVYKDTRELAKVAVEHGRRGAERQEARDQRHQDLRQRRQGRPGLPARAGQRRQDQLPEDRSSTPATTRRTSSSKRRILKDWKARPWRDPSWKCARSSRPFPASRRCRTSP